MEGGEEGGRPSVGRLRHEKDVFVRVNRAVTCIQRRRGRPPGVGGPTGRGEAGLLKLQNI